MGPRARKSPPPEAGRGRKGGSPSTSKRFCPHLDLGPGASRLWQCKGLLFEAPSLWSPVVQPQDTNTLSRALDFAAAPLRPPGPFPLDQGWQECGGCMRAPRMGFTGSQ